MPFPKEVRSAEVVSKELRGRPVSEFEGVTLMLKSFKVTESGKFGELIVLECEDEDGVEIKVSTFSAIVISQAQEIEQSLPLLIKPKKVSNYFVIY